MANRDLDIALRTADIQQSKGMNSQMSERMAASVKDMGQVDSMRHTILSYVASESYDRAIESLKSYLQSKQDYPKFHDRAERYISYAIDLINAIRAKRSFPGLSSLGMSKQQELFDKAMDHFEDLKATLKRVEKIEREVKLEDVRSTVIVVQVAAYCVAAFLALAFILEVSDGVLPSAISVLSTALDQTADWVFARFGL